MSNRHDSKIPILSFFSGAGFLDIGFLRTGKFFVPWHNECHPPFADAYEYGASKLGYHIDNKKNGSSSKIENLKADAIKQKAFGGKSPPIFGVIGGPPCPDFSRAGKNLGREGQNGKLTREFANKIIQLQPDFFLLENVPGLMEIKKHRNFLFSVIKKLSNFYAVDLKILNALDYGVPQNRRRVFVVGVRHKRVKQCFSPEKGREVIENSNQIVNLDISEKRSANDVGGDLFKLHWFPWPVAKFPDAATTYSWGKRQSNAPKKLKVGHQFSKINGHPNASDFFKAHSNKFQIIKEGDTSRKSFKRLHRYGYSPNAAYGNNEVHLHPTKPRRISVAEALVIQSVPKEYCFPENMTLTDKFKAVSNGVPVLLAESIASSFINFLTGGKNEI